MTTITLLVGAETLHVGLHREEAPGLTAAVLACAPHATIAVHTQTAGAEFCIPVPFFHWHENRREPRTGDVGYASFGNYICLYYGPMSEADGPTNVVGSVRDRETLARVGNALFEAGAARAQLLSAAISERQPPAAPLASTLLETVYTLHQATLTNPPVGIDELRSARLPGMGNTAGRLQASGFLMGLAEVLFMLRSHASDSSIEPALLASMLTKELLRYGRWLDLVGMPTVAGHLRVIASAFAAPVDEVELVRVLETMLVAVGRLRLWVDAVSPWQILQERLGDEAWLAKELRGRSKWTAQACLKSLR